MLCKICGSELSEADEAARFCKRCGSKVADEETEEEVKSNYHQVEVEIERASGGKNELNAFKVKEKKTKRFFSPLHVAAVLIFVAIFASVGIFFAVWHNPEDDMLKVNTVLEPTIEANYIANFSEGLAVISQGFVGRNQKYGYIDITGEIVIPCKYDYADNFREGMALVFNKGKYGFIDKTGTVVIPLQYNNAQPFSKGLACVWIDNKCGFINNSGETVIPFIYDNAYSFFGEYASVWKDGKAGLIDMEGNVVVPFEYDGIYFTYGNFYVAIKDSKQGLMDKSGNLIVPCIYDIISLNVKDGVISVQQGGKWGILEIENYEPPTDVNSWYGYNYGPFYY